ncbi:MAG: PEGA domain-containing protein [candidate division KSB1 bacterium]|nr:PEGA domain-containing protein [candidate division KSB1 bacterium]MDZ7288274.1 PEGA domain-containing protein [candidate division KSB1 bacterium]MDZ7300502.1 PEGA domain-containing protein [candidate division KSB1 bacterium]MDZ7308083.1 PEGA domain-containing protein [candidate division KSB1 bacterium]MDZ7351500.1 PEGA domain-containing protein [candidate division KSB1 bacterium]
MIGSIGKVGGTYAINIHLIDVASGRMEQSFKQDHRGRIDGLLPVLEKLALEIAEKVTSPAQTSGSERRKHRLKIFSHPPGAQVIINGKVMGKTPLAGSVPHARKINLVIRHEGCAGDRWSWRTICR